MSLSSGLFNFVDPMGKTADAVWIRTMGAIAGWGCDMVINAFKKKPL